MFLALYLLLVTALQAAVNPSEKASVGTGKESSPAAQEAKASPAPMPLVKNLNEYYSIIETHAPKRYRYSWDWDVLFYDASWKLLWLSQDGAADFFKPGKSPLPAQAGQRIHLEGEFAANVGIDLDDAKITVLPGSHKVKPLDITGNVLNYGLYNNQLVKVQTVVDRQSESDASHLLLETSTEETHLVLHVQVDPKEPRPQLEGSIITVTGVYAAGASPSRALSNVVLWVPGLSSIRIAEWLSTDPRFAVEATPIEAVASKADEPLVKIVGTVQSIDSSVSSIMIRDTTGQAQVFTAQANEIREGSEVEVIGKPEKTGIATRLRNAILRLKRGQSVVRALQSPDAGDRLRLADQVLALKPEDAARQIPVSLYGIATWADFEKGIIFLQDLTRGVEVQLPLNNLNTRHLPCAVSIVGHTELGPYAPRVVATNSIWKDPVGAPDARKVTLEQLMSGTEHGRWIEIQGYLRNLSQEDGCTRLFLTESSGDFTAELPKGTVMPSILGAVVNLRGVCQVIPNERRQLAGVKVLVPSAHFVDVVEAPQADPFAVEESPLARLREFTPALNYLRHVRTSGIVLLHEPGKSISIQNGEDTLLVLCRQSLNLAPGDYVEVVGIPGREGTRLVLREANCRVARKASQPTPQVPDARNLLNEALDGRLVRIEGKLVAIQQHPLSTSYLVQSDGRPFEVVLASTSGAHSTAARIDSRVSVTGVYRVKHDEYRQPIDFSLLIRSGSDVEELSAPPLLTPSRVLGAACILLLLLIAIVVWVAVLRRRVKEQTELIRSQFEHQSRLEADLQRAARIESVGLLAGGIAHDFNNLLTVVLGNVTFALTDERVVGAAGEELNEAKQGVLRARDLTQKLLTFSKGGDPFRTVLKMPDLTRETVTFALHGSNVRCTFTIAPDLWEIDADRTQIGQVIQNLTINAKQAMPKGGLVRIGLSNVSVAANTVGNLAAGKYVLLTCADEGVGITPELLPKVFDPYFTTKSAGHGLGLATSYSIVRKHQGHIEVDSEVGKGTTFRVWLPKAANGAASERPEAENEPVRFLDSFTDPVASGRVLVMDDEETVRLLCSRMLSRLGFEVTGTADGAEAVREFNLAKESGRPYQLVIFDLTIPGGLGGREAIAEVRKIDPSVRAIVSSGYSTDPVLAEYKRHGFDAVVPKPYEYESLSRTVKSLLG